MIAHASKTAVSYLRRSTDRQEQSLGDQRKEITRWAEANGYVLVGEYQDDAISGTSAKSRPGFQKMVADAKGGTFSAVIVWNSDRFSRGSVTETEHYRYLLQQANVSVVSVTEDFLDREGIDGDVLRAVKQFQNRQFSISLSQNTLRGQVSSVLGSSDPGRMPPYGYDRAIKNSEGTVIYVMRFLEGGDREIRDRHGEVQSIQRRGETFKKPGKQCQAHLVLSSADRVHAVKDIFQMCIDGVGFKGIADELNRRGIISPKGKLWSFTSVKALLANPTYRGDIVWNRRSQAKFFQVAGGRADRMRPSAQSGHVQHIAEDDWVVVENAVPAIIDRAMWEQAQKAASIRSDCKSGKGKQATRWLLSGVMKCGCCGQPFWGARKRKGRVAGRKDIVTEYYVCAGRIRSGKTVCPVSAHIKARDLETWVLQTLSRLINADAVGIEQAVEKFVETVRARQGLLADSEPIRRELAQLDQTVNALLTGLDPANLPLINDKLTTLRRRREALQRQLREAETGGAVDDNGLRKWATERILMLGELMAGRRDEKARQVMASYVDEIVVDPATKTGYMVVNAGLGDPEDDPQKPDDPPSGGSQVTGIAGARFGSNLRPRRRLRVGFRWAAGAAVRELVSIG